MTPEDLGVPEAVPRVRVVTLPADGREFARSLATSMAECFSRPSWRAGVVGSTVVGAVCMRQGMRPLPTFLLMVMAHYAAESLYGMAEDIRDNVATLAAREARADGA